MRIITLTDGSSAHVDDEDYPLLSRFNWYLSSSGYARTCFLGKFFHMHQMIMGHAPRGSRRILDHINQDRLDNRKHNLRWASKSENGLNSKLRSDNPTGYRGVRVEGSKYRAYCTFMGKQYNFGLYLTPEAAATARDEGMKRLHHDSPFLVLNDIDRALGPEIDLDPWADQT
jgi:hypothetical protein